MKKKYFINILFICSITICACFSFQSNAQDAANDIFAADDDDLNLGGDIFTDFSEDVEIAKVV